LKSPSDESIRAPKIKVRFLGGDLRYW